MTHRDEHEHEEEAGRPRPPLSGSPELYAPRRDDAVDKVTRPIEGKRMASYELINAFLPGKQLYIGLPEPYRFVEAPENGGPGLQRESCSCAIHQGASGTHILKLSEVSLALECGPDQVWVFITIPARQRSKYAWLAAEAFGPSVDAELCGVLVAAAG